MKMPRGNGPRGSRTRLGDDGNQIGALSALSIPHLNGSFLVFILGWMIAGMNFVLTSALTCFLSPRRGLRRERFLVGGWPSDKPSRANFPKKRRTILLLLGEKAGMREVVKPMADWARGARTRLGDDGNQMGALSALLAASKQLAAS
jgi:hypothetical protein